MAVEPALATFELTRHARQRILHQPDIAAALDRAGGLPRPIKTTDRPGSPQTRISRTVNRHGRRPSCGGKMGDRGVRTGIYGGSGGKRGTLGDGQIADGAGVIVNLAE